MFSKTILASLAASCVEGINREPLLSRLPLKSMQEKDPGYPMDYFVPNFGPDRDVVATQNHLAQQEVTHKHKLDLEGPPKSAEWPTDYAVPSFGQDRDVSSTLKHLATAEGKLGHKLDLVGPPKSAEWPMDYAVPNFGPDRDI